MDPKAAELPRERAASSEPCSTRSNPFDDNEHSSRKRQRVSRRGSRSRSVDTATASDSTAQSMPLSEGGSKSEADPAPPRTPTRSGPHPAPEPTSSRVTINLRTARPLESIPSSPPSPTTPSKMASDGADTGMRVSVELESDALSANPAIETPSSSPSAPGSPEIEVLTIHEDDEEFTTRSPPLAIIDEDELFVDPFLHFPYNNDGESLVATVRRLVHFIQYEPLEEESSFCRLRDWIESYLAYTHDRVDTWYETYSKYRTFWTIFPEVIFALSWRSRFFADFLEASREGHPALSGLLFQFARLTARFVAMDVRTLSRYLKENNNDEGPDLASRGYLQAYSYLLRKDEQSHIGRNLEAHYHWVWEEEVALLTNAFQTAGGSLPTLIKLAEGQLRLTSQNPKIIDNLSEPCRLVAKVLSDAATILGESGQHRRQSIEAARQQLTQGYDFFGVMSAGLEKIIEKQVTFLTPDSAITLVLSLANILYSTLLHDNSATRELLAAKRGEYPDIQTKYFPKIISLEWKFTILKRLITSAQMQLRVVGVTTMCGDLLSLHGAHKGNDPSQNPILLYFADFVIRNKIVEYLVGIASHPEIINESNNILGFLIVTNTFKQSQASTIWQTVTTSQDPRVVEAILRMLKRCLNLQKYEDLLFLCEKVKSLPIEAFTATMRDFCEELFRTLVSKAACDGIQYVDAPPYELCVRLIRESSMTTPESPVGYPDIQNFAAGRFRELLAHGPNGRIREEIYLECISDVSDRTATAPGSICVINALLRQNMGTDLHTLTTEHGLTQLVIQELESTIAEDRHSSNPSIRNSPASQARRELLLTIIIYEPGTISPELGTKLWNLLVGSESRSVIDRNTWWQILNSAMKKSPSENVFITACFKDHLPTLPPDCFTIGALDFAREAIASWLEASSQDSVDEDREFESLALEQLWRMILTAPPNTIDAQAIHILVEVYVESGLILSLPRAKARSIHLALVDRCLKQLAGAATKLKSFDQNSVSSGEEKGMVLVASENEFQEQEMIFARSLAVLREFLKTYQTKPQFATPKSRSPLSDASSALEGDPLEVRFQSFDGDKHTEVMSLTLGKRNTAAFLFASLQKATGFKNFKVFYGGKGFDPDEVDLCKSLEELNFNGLVLVQRRDEEDGPGHTSGSKTSLELEVTKHLDELWSYLGMHEKVAQEIYYFLIKFPVYDRLLADFDSEAISYSEVFPQGQPFKSLYAIYALREYIRVQSQKGTVNGGALTRATSLIVAAISNPDVLDHCSGAELKDCLALHLIDCFVVFLREPILPPSVASLLNDTLLKRLLQLLYSVKSVAASQNSVHLTWRCFEALLEASLQNSAFWSSFKSHLASTALLKDLLLEDPRVIIRKSVAKLITTKCTFSPSLACVSTTDFATAFWPMVATLIPMTAHHPQQCEETLSLALTLFKKLAETSLEFISLDDVIRQWGSLLLSHNSKENVGHPESIDMVAQGLAKLCHTAASFAKASQQPLTCSAIGADLFRKHLFPDLSLDNTDDNDRVIVPRIPLLNTTTRHVISETIFHLVKDDEAQYKNILLLLSTLVPYELTDEGPYVYELPFIFERSKSVRSPTGYVGLRNLSNTCYLNSLFTQLFMNIPFREFMLTAHVADGGASQKLLSETQNLFSYMQNSLRRFVDPANLAASIRTYEETNIDVSIQMDVDEFYNLLFDRWESQILAPDAKRQFRSFYGGQLVQQVKSKECAHISERLEPFSAIQCDIKGKSCLQESLQAYVDGEIMEGDNKYKCSTCDRHVDAVKRACLKDIPDNLIFHLKRFDFNLRTLQRSKINDYFSFPEKIDMRPYKVEHLMDNPDGSAEDVFELVGILVHSGTAESGHYYSYIRERPSNSDKENWVEFNDDSVTPWDPKCMESACFGGIDYRGPVDNVNMQYDKSYSAYMLFYQRSSVLATQQQALEHSGVTSPIRLPISPRISNHIAMENELLMRKYCLYDPSHTAFVTKMLANMKQINKGRCSDSHSLEKLALTVSLNHLDQVIGRTKDLPDFQNFMLGVRQICHSCAECSRDFLEWFCDRPDTLRHLLVRNPDALVRSEMASSINFALVKVKTDAAYAYGLGDDEDSIDGLDACEDPRLLQRVVRTITRLWDIFHTNCRAWPEYFGLLSCIANLGEHESVLLLDAGFLRKTLEVISADNLLPLSNQYQRMISIISKRIATRPVSYESVISLLHRLIETCDLSLESIPDNDERLESSLNGGAIPLTHTERHLLMQHWTRGQAHILTEKLLQIHQNHSATRDILIILLHCSESLDHYIFQAIIHGIRRGSASIPCGPFLRAAILYCEHSEEPQAIATMVLHVTKVASRIENIEGKEFLQFYKDVVNLEDNKNDIPREEIIKICLEQVPSWAPGLLNCYDGSVREGTEAFLAEILLRYGPQVELGTSAAEVEKANTILQVAQKLGVACLDYLNEVYVRLRQPAVRASLESILNVIATCTTYFDEEARDPLTRRFFEMRSTVLPALKRFTVEEVDEEVSDWDGSEGEYGSSEPMDSIAEFCGAVNDDLDTDVQL